MTDAEQTINEEDFTPPPSTRERIGRWGTRAPKLTATFEAYLRLLLARNAEFNLTGDKTPAEQWTRHIEDALAAAVLIEERIKKPAPGEKLLDVGSGGGIPGLIFATIWPNVEVTLMEATGKKAHFLEEAAATMGLTNVKVVNMRAEDAGMLPAYREQFHWVTSRALAGLSILAEWTVPFAKWSGKVIAFKGEDVRRELSDAGRAFRVLAVPWAPKIFPYRLATGRAYTLLVFTKIGMTPSQYPRRAGIAQKKPL